MSTDFFHFRHMGSDQEILEKVRAFADEAHGAQMRKYTEERYIAHPMRVMETCREYTQQLPVLAAALLHDVLEDTNVSETALTAFLSSVMTTKDAEKTFQLVEELTDVFIKSDYPALNRRTRRTREAERLAEVSAEAQTIKYADVIDNVVDITKNDADFALVYLRENKQLLREINKGNQWLYGRAVQTVDDCLRQFWNKANIRAL
jgi:guanosine-3',5'-bis(diphosphate) 3'-pyrophosphohydrolase